MSLNIWNVIQVGTISYRLNLEAFEGQAQIQTDDDNNNNNPINDNDDDEPNQNSVEKKK